MVLNNVILSTPIVCIVLVIINICVCGEEVSENNRNIVIIEKFYVYLLFVLLTIIEGACHKNSISKHLRTLKLFYCIVCISVFSV